MIKIQLSEKPNCYKCEYSRKSEYSAHTQCNHPTIVKILENPSLLTTIMVASIGGINPFLLPIFSIIVKGDPYGISQGWFNFPLDFDPLWLEKCNGFMEKKEQKK